MDWVQMAKLAVLGVGLFMLLGIASQPGWSGKVFVLVVAVLGYYIYSRINKGNEAPNPLNIYHDRLKKLCKRANPGGLRRLIMTGDGANNAYVKGKILGGPIYEINKRLEPQHPKLMKFLFLYTPDTGWLFTVPPFSWIMGNFRREILFAVFHNPNARPPVSQLKNKAEMVSPDKRDRTAHMMGDVKVRGINTYFVREIEYVNDELFDIDAEMLNLGKSVDVLTLENDLESLVKRIRNAIDANSGHQRALDLKDFSLGDAKASGGEAS